MRSIPRPLLLKVAAAVGSAVALTLVVRRLPAGQLSEVFSSLRWGWYGVAAGLFGLALVPSGLRWHLMLRLNRVHVSGGASVRLTFVSHFFNTLLAGPATGDIPKTALYSKWFGWPLPDVLAASILDRSVSGMAGALFIFLLLVLGVLAGAIGSLDGVGLRVGEARPWVGLAAIGIGVVVLWVVGLARRPGSFVARTWVAFRAGAGRLVDSGPSVLIGVGLSLGVVGCLTAAQLACFQAVSPMDLPWLRLAWAFHVATMISSLPVTFAGVGLREGAYVVLLGLYGVPAPVAVAAALLTLTLHAGWAAVGWGLWWREHSLRRERPAIFVHRFEVIPIGSEGEGGYRLDLAGVPGLEGGSAVVVLPPGAAVCQKDLEGIARVLRDTTVVGGVCWTQPDGKWGRMTDGVRRFLAWGRLALWRRGSSERPFFVRREVWDGLVADGATAAEIPRLGPRIARSGRLVVSG